MDKIDVKILKCLKENARLTASAISEKIGLSVSAVIDRIRKMESGGIISGYTINLNNKKMGNEIMASMEVSLKSPDYLDDFTRIVNENPYITTCYYQTGNYDFVLNIITDSAEGLENVYRQIKSYEGVSQTETHLILRTLKNESCVLVED